MNVLVVDDDPLVGPGMRAVLEHAGHRVIGLCRDASKALRLVRHGRPDVAIVDICLAGGEDGFSLVRKLKEVHAVPALIVSGYAHRAGEARGLAVGFLRKPFPPADLVAAVACVERVIRGQLPSPLPATDPGATAFPALGWIGQEATN